MTAAAANVLAPLLAVDEETPSAGLLTYWSLTGGLDPLDLATSWEEAGLSAKEHPLPELPHPTTALRRAVRYVVSGKRMLVRPLEARGAHAIVAERAIEEETAVDSEGGTGKAISASLEHEVTARVTLDAANRVVVEPADSPYVAELRAAFNRSAGECSTSEVGSWLVDRVLGLDGVALRTTGGFYYLPPKSVEPWRKMALALQRVSGHRVLTIPALRSKDAVEAVLLAIEEEASTEADQLATELDEHISGEKKLGERAFATRAERITRTQQKLGRYEALLGAHSEKLTERLAALAVQVSAAALAAMAEETGEEAGAA